MAEINDDINPNIIFERRRFVRIGANFVVSYRDASSKEAKSDISQTRNISTGGLLFTTDKQFKKDSILILRLRLPDAAEYINVKVKVIASKQKAKGILYETRVHFIGIRDDDREAIRKIVEYKLEQ